MEKDPKTPLRNQTVEELVDEFLTPERKQELWGELQKGLAKKKRETKRGPRRNAFIWLGPAFAALCIIGFLVVPGKKIGMEAVTEDRDVGQFPTRLEFSAAKSEIRLFQDGPTLTGTITPTNSVPGTFEFSAKLRGKDAAGQLGIFSGTLTVTNALGITTIKSASDILGARLYGFFVQDGRSTNEISIRYAPIN